MHVLMAALDAYARRYADLGIKPTAEDAQALVDSLAVRENVEPKPSQEALASCARDFMRMVDEYGSRQREGARD